MQCRTVRLERRISHNFVISNPDQKREEFVQVDKFAIDEQCFIAKLGRNGFETWRLGGVDDISESIWNYSKAQFHIECKSKGT